MNKKNAPTPYEMAMQAVDRIIAELDEELARINAKKDYMLQQKDAIIRTKEATAQ